MLAKISLLILFLSVASFATENNLETCNTPDGSEGICKPFKSCSSLWDIFKNNPVSPENLQLLRDSICEEKDGKYIMCCPNASEEEESVEFDFCVAHDFSDGVCKPFKDCSSLWDIFKKTPVSSENMRIIQNSKCGEKDGKHFMCCPNDSEDDSLFEISNRISETCTTPNDFEGICKPLKFCTPLKNLLRVKPVPSENHDFIRESKCPGERGRKVNNVCCPLPPTPTTQAPTTTEHPENTPCKDARQNEGTCVKFRDCAKAFNLFKQKPLPPKDRQFLRDSQCAFIDQIPYVCCADVKEETVTEENVIDESAEVIPDRPAWLETLEAKVPKAPDCGHDLPDRVFGGEKTDIDELPWLALLHFVEAKGRNGGTTSGFHCGGSLINERYVLTAAHCVRKIRERNVTSVRLGEWDLKSTTDCSPDDSTVCAPPVQDINIVETRVYHDYRPNAQHNHYDIALLKLATKVKFTEFIAPICLPLDPSLWTKDYTGHTFLTAGWGRTETKKQSDFKLKVSIKFQSIKECRKAYKSQKRDIVETQICAGGETGKDSCNGDSGGPLMINNVEANPPYWYLAGIVSHGPSNCGTTGIPGVYTRVSSFLEWLSKNIKK